MENKRRRGRPAKDQNESKSHKLLVRMNDEEWKELNEMSEVSGLSKSECLRLSLHYQKGRLPTVNYFKKDQK